MVCRHTLEHIAPVHEFMSMVRRAIGDRPETIVLFELPDVKRVLEEVAFWDVYHEHCSYFSLGSLARLFRATGFEVLNLEVDYDGQYLLDRGAPFVRACTRRALVVEDDLELLASAVEKYHVEVEALRETWRARFGAVKQRGGKAVIWGGGSKGVSFLTNLGSGRPGRLRRGHQPIQDRQVHGRAPAIEVVAPEFLLGLKPELVVAMNSIYLDEIKESSTSWGSARTHRRIARGTTCTLNSSTVITPGRRRTP